MIREAITAAREARSTLRAWLRTFWADSTPTDRHFCADCEYGLNCHQCCAGCRS